MKSTSDTKYLLPAKIEGLLATLSASYGRKKEVLLQRIVVNASYKIDEGYDYDNWDGGQTGHLIHLVIPAALFLDTMDTLSKIEDRIAADLNGIAKCPHEHVSAVTVEQADATDILRWREESGVLLTTQKANRNMSDVAERLWGQGYLRAFLSHKTEYKKQAAELKSSLTNLGIAAFVAHDDIEPTREWQNEIELALSTQDVCIALLTEKYHDSNWTDQEIGISIGRGVPIVAVRLGRDPYGFIGKFQAFSGGERKSDEIAVELMRAFLGNERLNQRMASALVLRFEHAKDFAHAKKLMEYIEELKSLSPDLIDRLEQAPKNNMQIRESYGVASRLASKIACLRAL